MDALTGAAVAGTSRETPPKGGFPTDGLFEDAAGMSPERELLLRAGARAVYRTAGRAPEQGVGSVRPAPEETMQTCSAKAAEIMHQLLAGQRDAILHEALERLRLARLRLPHALLPEALDYGRKDLRPAVAAACGERGRWLAALNPDWRWAAAAGPHAETDYEMLWEEGALEERLAALRRVRRQDPVAGRRWVEGAWKEEKAEARAAMVAALEAGLSSRDEPFLEKALDDRSVKVREAAAALLVRFRDSAYAARAIARADAVLVRYEPAAGGLQGMAAGLLGEGRGRLTVEPPEDVDREWRRDLPGGDEPPRGVGRKAWRISRALAAASPDHWEERFGVGPVEVIGATRGSDWESAVLAGWCHAARLHGSRGWALPLWERCFRISDDLVGRLTWEAALSLAPMLPQEEFSVALPELLFGEAVEMPLRLSATLRVFPSPWRSDLSDAYLESLRKRLRGFEEYGQARGEDPWLLTLPHAMISLSPESLDEATGLKDLLGRWAGKGNQLMLQWEKELTRFEETLELRRKLVKEIPL